LKKILLVVGVLVVIVAVVTVFVMRNNDSSKEPTRVTAVKDYVALGDSVAAGAGLIALDASACDRSNQSYPALLAKAQRYTLHDFSCSGATIAAGITGSQTVNQSALEPQLNKLFGLPTTPDLITLTIGANDANWTRLTACYTGNCGNAVERQEATQSLETMKANLTDVLSRIDNHYETNKPKVVVTGYYQVVPLEVTNAACTDLSGVDASERIWIRQFQADLSTAVQQAVEASAHGVFAPIDFSEHELCTEEPWVQGLQDKAPYHPTANGQKKIMNAVAAALKVVR
jgi:lysophospholipase L1-like esterase